MRSFEKLKAKLAELFQLEQADLDFGIYRIMNARREEITRFLERDLLPQVREAFGEYRSSDKGEMQKELDKVIEGVKAAGMDPKQAPKVKELRARLAEEAVDVSALENEVYDHLYSFFSRYYDEGDFISLRRYKEGVYALPNFAPTGGLAMGHPLRLSSGQAPSRLRSDRPHRQKMAKGIGAMSSRFGTESPDAIRVSKFSNSASQPNTRPRNSSTT